jgi:hypothetical protein
MPTVTFEPAPVMTDGAPQPGRLVMADGALVVLMPAGGEVANPGWLVEAGFGPCGTLFTTMPEAFRTLGEVEIWVRACLARGGAVPTGRPERDRRMGAPARLGDPPKRDRQDAPAAPFQLMSCWSDTGRSPSASGSKQFRAPSGADNGRDNLC